ncbi:hypothetical protein ACTXT7_015138 [Hymenolepis weldensis]
MVEFCRQLKCGVYDATQADQKNLARAKTFWKVRSYYRSCIERACTRCTSNGNDPGGFNVRHLVLETIDIKFCLEISIILGINLKPISKDSDLEWFKFLLPDPALSVKALNFRKSESECAAKYYPKSSNEIVVHQNVDFLNFNFEEPINAEQRDELRGFYQLLALSEQDAELTKQFGLHANKKFNITLAGIATDRSYYGKKLSYRLLFNPNTSSMVEESTIRKLSEVCEDEF